ncbi:hypothetical protein TNCV_5108711 [Trichonephila clavipes]|nr:hypothetical protein TNCV_5108711 [Trichonephila clavipes]
MLTIIVVSLKVLIKTLNTIPSVIREKIKLKNRIRKDWQDTKYPPYKTQLNKLQKEIKKELQNYHNFKWDKLLAEATPDDDSLYKIVKTHSNKNKSFHIPPIVGPMGLHYSTEDKDNLFADSLSRAHFKKIRSHMMTISSTMWKRKSKIIWTVMPDATPLH